MGFPVLGLLFHLLGKTTITKNFLYVHFFDLLNTIIAKKWIFFHASTLTLLKGKIIDGIKVCIDLIQFSWLYHSIIKLVLPVSFNPHKLTASGIGPSQGKEGT